MLEITHYLGLFHSSIKNKTNFMVRLTIIPIPMDIIINIKEYQQLRKVLGNIMHELSLAESLLKSANQIAIEKLAKKINKLYISIGEFALIMEEQFSFCLDIMKQEFELTKDIEIEISREPGVLLCNQCGHEGPGTGEDEPQYGLAAIFKCSKCQSYDTEILTGMETYIEKMDVTLNSV
jgi:hydrogenase nickel insertion protein HypA